MTTSRHNEKRGNLRPTPRHCHDRARIHDFNNALLELVLAVQVGEPEQVQNYCEVIRGAYLEAVTVPARKRGTKP